MTLLGIIKAAQRLGFTLDEVAELMDTGRRPHATPDLQERARAKLAEIDQKISDLQAIRGRLEKLVAARCDSLTNCSCPDCPMPFADLAHPDGETR